MSQPIDVLYMLAERRRIVSWLRKEPTNVSCQDNKNPDCNNNGECRQCIGARAATIHVRRLADAIERGEHNV